MASAQYSKAVLQGLEKKGLTLADVASITARPESKIRAIQREKAHFTDGDLSAIEDAVRMSAGQLAMSTVKADKALRSIMNGWAAVRSGATKKSRGGKKRLKPHS